MVPSADEIKQDWNWRQAFQEAINGGYGATYDDENPGPIAGVVEVICAESGENDGPEWIGVFLMDDHRYAVVAAGCDYTGWDCQASGTVEYFQSVDAAVSKLSLGEEQRNRLREQLEEQECRGRLQLDWDHAET